MNLSLLLDMAADGFGDRPLVGGRSAGVTAARIRRLSIGGARALRAANADALVYLGVNGPMFPIALFSAARAGVPFVPVNYRLGNEQLMPLLANHPQALGLACPGEIDRVRAAGLAGATADDWLATIDGLAEDGPTEEEASDRPDATGSAPAVLIYTSGSTSVPKGVLIRHENLVSYVLSTVEFAAAAPADAALVSLPPYHIAAVANAVTNLYAGRRTVVLEQFDPARWLDVVRREQITQALLVPTMLARIMTVADDLLDVPSLRTLAYGGAPMPVRVLERALGRWPHVDFVNAYGLTETSSTIAVLGPGDHRTAFASDEPEVRARLGSAGQVVPSIELQIRDEKGLQVGPGVVGQIWVRGDQVSGEYAAGGSALDAERFFDTRDRGEVDDDGYLFIRGRADDTIIRGGENIAPAEIEEVLLSFDDVVDAMVIGIPDDVWGQRIEAAVVLRAGADTDPVRLREKVRGHLRGAKTPDLIHVWDDLPRTETGKLIRREAVERAIAAAS